MVDGVLPDQTGAKLLRAATAVDPYLVAILVTDLGSPRSDLEVKDAGAFIVVARPFRVDTLLPVLQRALELRQVRLENVRLKESVAIYELSNQVAFSQDVTPILDKISDTALHQTRADEVSIMLLTRKGNALYVAAARGANREAILGRRVSLDRGVAGWVARHREMLILRGEITDKRFKPIRPRSDIRSAISLPMLSAGALVGVLNVNATSGLRSFTPGQVNALGVLANIAASVVRTASLYAQVREAEEKYRSIFENSIEGIYQTTRDGQFVSANPSLAAMYGYDSALDLMNRVADVSREIYVDPKRHEELLARLDAGGSAMGFESQIRRKDGTLIWISESARAVVSGTGDGVYYEGTVEDITQRKHAEIERDRSETALRESNRHLASALETVKQMQDQIIMQERLRALGQMASGVAHDFNNDLAMIVGFSELLLKRPEDLNNSEKARSYLQMIRTVAGDAASAVNRLHEFFRQREEGEIFSPVDVNQIVEQVILFTQPRWRYQAQANGVTIHVDTKLQRLPAILREAADLREAMTNLILNAVDAMPQGGTLTVSTRYEAEQVFLAGSDTGAGMSEEVRQRCLEPFFTTKGEKGTGLGLSTVYGTVRRHDGSVGIQTAVGEGTTVTIQLPVDAGEVESASPALPPDVAVLPRRVLVVEDEEPLRRILGEYLTLVGHAVETAVSGGDGVEKFLGSGNDGAPRGHFDLVVTDLAKPEMSGDQLALAVKQIAPRTPIILLTGLGEMMRASGECPDGVDLIVSKPVSYAALQQAVAQVAQV
jgi:PAS domain S-box-containing protein